MLLFFRTLFPPDCPHYTERMIRMAEINPNNKSFELSLNEFKQLCFAYKAICDENPELLQYNYRSDVNAPLWRNHQPKVNIENLN